MGMSTKAVGFRPPDEAWDKHKAVWDACIRAGVDIPIGTRDFFEDEEPDSSGIVVDISASCYDFNGDGEAGIMVELPKLPKGLKFIRFINSW